MQKFEVINVNATGVPNLRFIECQMMFNRSFLAMAVNWEVDLIYLLSRIGPCVNREIATLKERYV